VEPLESLEEQEQQVMEDLLDNQEFVEFQAHLAVQDCLDHVEIWALQALQVYIVCRFIIIVVQLYRLRDVQRAVC